MGVFKTTYSRFTLGLPLILSLKIFRCVHHDPFHQTSGVKVLFTKSCTKRLKLHVYLMTSNNVPSKTKTIYNVKTTRGSTTVWRLDGWCGIHRSEILLWNPRSNKLIKLRSNVVTLYSPLFHWTHVKDTCCRS